LGIVALTVCCFLLLYSAGCAAIASNDQSLVVVNLTGRALLLSDPELAPFYTLPAPQEVPASVLPPIRPRTYYVVTAELGHLAKQAGRADVFVVDTRTSTDFARLGPCWSVACFARFPSPQFRSSPRAQSIRKASRENNLTNTGS